MRGDAGVYAKRRHFNEGAPMRQVWQELCDQAKQQQRRPPTFEAIKSYLRYQKRRSDRIQAGNEAPIWGSAPTKAVPELIERVRELLDADPTSSYRQLAAQVGQVSPGTIMRIVRSLKSKQQRSNEQMSQTSRVRRVQRELIQERQLRRSIAERLRLLESEKAQRDAAELDQHRQGTMTTTTGEDEDACAIVEENKRLAAENCMLRAELSKLAGAQVFVANGECDPTIVTDGTTTTRFLTLIIDSTPEAGVQQQ